MAPPAIMFVPFVVLGAFMTPFTFRRLKNPPAINASMLPTGFTGYVPFEEIMGTGRNFHFFLH